MTLPTGASHDPDAERAVLAACLDSATARAEARKHITSADFGDPRHADIWDAAARLDRHGQSVDPVTIRAVAGPHAQPLLPDIVTTVGLPDHVASYASIVRGWAIRRALWREATATAQTALNPDANPAGMAAGAANRFAAIRDSGAPDNTTAQTLGELLATEDDEPDWLIPGLLERRDRLILTGTEGTGKSHVLRQIAIQGAAGLHPFDCTRIRPVRVTIIDAENSQSQVRRRSRRLAWWAQHHGHDPRESVLVDCTGRMDITRDRDLSRVHALLDAAQPDLVVIGPLYKLVPRALQTDDEAAPLLAALDTIRERDHGPALLMEAHAGHALGSGGQRDLRPRGSSALLGWPEFGYGMRAVGHEGADLVPWRGDRDARSWPKHLRRSRSEPRWVPDESRQEIA